MTKIAVEDLRDETATITSQPKPAWIEKARFRLGMCYSCNSRLYEVKDKGRFTPLTITGIVCNGRCLLCYPVENTRGSRVFGSKASKKAKLCDTDLKKTPVPGKKTPAVPGNAGSAPTTSRKELPSGGVPSRTMEDYYPVVLRGAVLCDDASTKCLVKEGGLGGVPTATCVATRLGGDDLEDVGEVTVGRRATGSVTCCVSPVELFVKGTDDGQPGLLPELCTKGMSLAEMCRRDPVLPGSDEDGSLDWGDGNPVHKLRDASGLVFEGWVSEGDATSGRGEFWHDAVVGPMMKYEGEYKSGMFHGKGELTKTDGNMTKKGVFERGLMVESDDSSDSDSDS